MKLSLLTATLILTGSLYASSTHKVSATQEGVIAIKLLNTVLKTNLQNKLQEDNNGTSSMQVCITEADRTMQQMNNEVPNHVKMSIASPDASLNASDLALVKKYQKDIKNKTAGSMMSTRVKVGDKTRIYKPMVVDATWLACHDDKSEVALGDFKGVIIAEISNH